MPNPQPDPPRRIHRQMVFDNCAEYALPLHLRVSRSPVDPASAGAATGLTPRGSVRYDVAEAELRARVGNALQRRLGRSSRRSAA